MKLNRVLALTAVLAVAILALKNKICLRERKRKSRALVHKTIDMIKDNPPRHQNFNPAIVKKYFKIKQIVESWREIGLDYDSWDAMENIDKVIGNEDIEC